MADQQEAQKKFAARWFEEVWNQSRREAIDEMFPRTVSFTTAALNIVAPPSLSASTTPCGRNYPTFESLHSKRSPKATWSACAGLPPQNTPAPASISKSPA